MAHRHDDTFEEEEEEERANSVALDLLSSVNRMTDVVLIASDGDRIPASRFVLGARSPVLQRMLFSENSCATSSIDYNGLIVRAVVEYCRTNHILEFSKQYSCPRQVVQLCDCASSLELLGLQKRTGELVMALLKKDPSKACLVFDEASGENLLGRLALRTIQSRPKQALLPTEFSSASAISLSPASLEKIVSNKDMNCEEIVLFQAVSTWAATSKDHHQRGTSGDCPKKQARKKIAKALVKSCLDLSRIAPSDLVGTVAESGLVEPAAVWNALKEAALRTERERHDVVFSMRRRNDNQKEFPPLLSTNAAIEQTHDASNTNRFGEVLGVEKKAHGNVVRKVSFECSDNESSSSLVASESSSTSWEPKHGNKPSRKLKKRSTSREPKQQRRSSSSQKQEAVEQMGKSDMEEHEKNKAQTGVAAAAASDGKKSSRVQGNLVSLAEKLDTLCVCGSSDAENLCQ